MSGHGHEHDADIVSPGESSYTNSRVVQEEKETKSSVERWSSGQESGVSVEGGRRVLRPRNLQPLQDTTAFQPCQAAFKRSNIFEATSKLEDQPWYLLQKEFPRPISTHHGQYSIDEVARFLQEEAALPAQKWQDFYRNHGEASDRVRTWSQQQLLSSVTRLPASSHSKDFDLNLVPNVDNVEDEMVAWRQRQLDPTLERSYWKYIGPLPPVSETHLLKESFGYRVAEAVRSSIPASASEKANCNDGAAVTEAMMMMGAGRDAGLVPQTGPEAFSRLRTVAVNNNSRASGCSRTVYTGLTPGDFEKEGLTAPQVAIQCSTVRADSHESDEESGESGDDVAREPRYTIGTRTNLQDIDDGYKWRKYRQKAVENSPHPRNYYKCNTHKCPVKKRVERSTEDPGLLITTYNGIHAHPSFNLKSFKRSPRPGGPGSTPRDRDKEGLTAPQLHMAHESGEKATTSGDDNDVDVAMTLHRMEPYPEDPCLLLSKLVNFSSLADPAPSFDQHLQAGDTGWTPSDLDTIRLIHDPLESCYVDSEFQAWNVVDQMEPVVQHDFNLDYPNLDHSLPAWVSEFNSDIDMVPESPIPGSVDETHILSSTVNQEATTSSFEDHKDDHTVDVPTLQRKLRARRCSRRPCIPPRLTITRLNAVSDDGYKWRKFGQKAVKNSPHPRDYYRCSTPNCPVQKRTERSTEDPDMLITIYRHPQTHNHPMLEAEDSSDISKSLNHSPRVVASTGLMRGDLDMDKEGFTAPEVHIHLTNKEELELSKAKGHGTMVENVISFGDSIEDISNDNILCDDEFFSLVKKRMEAITSIQIVDIQEAFSQDHSFDQSTIVLGLFNATSNNLEFYFESGEKMAKLVGVGLHHAKVIVKLGVIFEVQEIETKEWEKLWHDVKEGSTKECKILKVRLPQMSGNIVSGGGLGEGRDVAISSASVSHTFQDRTSMAANHALQVPCLWEISKFFIMEKVIDAFHSKVDNTMWNESIDVECMDNDQNGGNEAYMTWYGTLKVLFSRGASSQNSNNQRQEDTDEGEGNGNGSRGDGDPPRRNSNIDQEDKETFAQVNVILLSGGDFFEKNMEPISNRHPISIERLENVMVTPELTFGFHKSRGNKKIQITTSVVFALDKDCDSIDSCPHSINHAHESCGHFGWFHDELHESLGPINQHIQRTAILKHDFKEGDYAGGKTISKASTAKDITKGNERSYYSTLAVGSNQIARLSLGASMRQQSSRMDRESYEQSLESNCNLTEGGFKIQAKHIMHSALLQYKYLAPFIDIIVEQVQDRKYRYDLIDHPMCNLQKTQFSGTWLPIGNDEVATYAFKANRKLHEIRVEEETFLTSSSSGLKTLFKKRSRNHLEVHICSSLEPPLTQAYEKHLHVNHAMSHLVDGQTYTLIESSSPQNPPGYVDGALVMFPILVDYQ